MSLAQWNHVLDAAGLQRAVTLPVEAHPLERLGQRVFAAQAKVQRLPLTASDLSDALGPELARVCPAIQIVDALPLTAAGALDTDCLQRWAASAARIQR